MEKYLYPNLNLLKTCSNVMKGEIMNRKELTKRVANVMRENNIRKPISAYRQTFHISDDEGNTSDFIIKKSDRGVLYTYDDIDAVMEACIAVIEDALKHGEHISIRGFGTLALHYRKARTTKHPDTGEEVVVPERYIPKFTYGKDLRMCAKIFELALTDGLYEYNDVKAGDTNAD